MKHTLLYKLVNDLNQGVYRVCVKGPGLETWLEAGFQSDASENPVLGDGRKRNLDYLLNSLKAHVSTCDADNYGGELSIRLPSETVPLVADGQVLRISVEFCLEKPQGGVQFVSSEGDALEDDTHMFTYKYGDGSRMWFPCIDVWSGLCTWKIEVTVDKNMAAVCPGDLVEKVFTPDEKRITFHYNLSVPTAAPNIAMAIGKFEVYVDPSMPDITHFCLPGLLPLLKNSVTTVNEAFEFYEETLSCRFPYSCYKQVFVNEAYEDHQAFASMTICSVGLLHSARIIEQTFKTRSVISRALAEQYFGSFVMMHSWCDAWLMRGISGYLALLFLKKMFGANYYKHHIWKELEFLCDYELNGNGLPPIYPFPLATDPLLGSNASLAQAAADEQPRGSFVAYQQHPHLISSRQLDVLDKKSHLVVRMIELRVGQDLLLQTLNKLLALASTAVASRKDISGWSNCLVTTPGFLKTMSTVSGKDIVVFVDQWICHSGVAHFVAKFNFNRKKNIIELEITQNLGRGCLKYVGPLVVSVQELDGSFNHTVQVEDIVTHHKIPCHSKSRRNKKKKIPLWTGEEVDMDLSATLDSDSPVLWLRLDPDMTWNRKVDLSQPDYMWEYQLRYERHVTSQVEAVIALERYPSQSSRDSLIDTVQNTSCFYPVRLAAADCLAKIGSVDLEAWNGDTFMIDMYRKMFSSNSSLVIPKFNDFSNFVLYFLQKHLPVSMSTLKNSVSQCPPTVVHFLVDLLKFNDNRFNEFSAGYYKSALIDALVNTISPALKMAPSNVADRDNVPDHPESKLVFAEIVLCLNLEKVLPSYKFAVTCSCLEAIRALQVYGHIPAEAQIFWKYSEYQLFEEIRKIAMRCLIDFIKTEQSVSDLMKLLAFLSDEPAPSMKHHIMLSLIENPPFSRQTDSCFNTFQLVETLWHLMTVDTGSDPRLRCDIIDLYRIFWGVITPSSAVTDGLGVVIDLKERKATSQSSKRSSEKSHSHSSGSSTQDKKRKVLDRGIDSAADLQNERGDMTVESSSGSKLKFKLKSMDDQPGASSGDADASMRKLKKKKKKKHRHKDKRDKERPPPL